MAIGDSMATLVATERHLWLNLSYLKENDKFFLLDAPLLPSGLSSVMLLTLSSSLRDLRSLWSWGLSTEVVETILQSRAPSMRIFYALKLCTRFSAAAFIVFFFMISH